MIEIKNISKEFEKLDEKKKKIKFLADNDISFEVKDGEILGLLGPNGAGKTTLLRMLAGIMKPTSGEITIGGKNYNDDVELLEMCASYYGMDKKITDERIDEVVQKFDMEPFKNQKIGSLSTGQGQRVGVSRCVLHDPHYYIFDEATSGLDIISSKVILDFIKEEKEKGKCIIYSTHYMEEAENICDRVVLINKGKVIAIGTPDEIEKQTKTTNIRDAFFSLIESAGEKDEME